VKIISFSQPVLLQNQTGNAPPTVTAINPGERVVINDDMAMQVNAMKENKLESLSDFDPFYKAAVQRPMSFKGKRVLFYRNRGIGDQLCASALPRYFTEKLKAQCFQLADNQHENLWVGNPYISGMPVRFPLSIDSLIRFKGRPFYDYFFPLESVSEWLSEPEQSNYYDYLFALCGINPTHVGAEYKIPVWGTVQYDIAAFSEWKKLHDIPDEYITLQLRATNLGRTPPVKAIDIILSKLNTLGIPILCMDDQPLSKEMIDIGSRYSNARNMATSIPNIRLYGSVIGNSKMAVGPDSSAIHFAAALGVPSIGLWGPFSPECRAKHYSNHYPIYTPELCPNCPCFNFMTGLPKHKCPQGEGQQHCEVFEGVTPEVVEDVVNRVVDKHKIV
jgi:ADP-heptose:LPS heptosyltransferase